MQHLKQSKIKQINAIRAAKEPSFAVTYDGNEFKIYGDRSVMFVFYNYINRKLNKNN